MLKVLDFTKLYSLSSERKLEYSQSDRCWLLITWVSLGSLSP